MGQPQFMPSSYLRYAVDFDGDGRRDIWTSHADALASIANYLKHHGWRGDQTWGRPVRVTPAAAKRIVVDLGARDSGCRAIRGMIGPAPLAHWQRLGVRRSDGGDLPVVARAASLVQVGTRHFLLYGNYDALLSYNCAHNYALTVALLADRIGEVAAAPRGALSRPAPPVPAAPRAEDAAARPSSPHSRCAIDVPPGACPRSTYRAVGRASSSRAAPATAVPSKNRGFWVPQRRTALAKVKSRKLSGLITPSSTSSWASASGSRMSITSKWPMSEL
jgi:hypothetical protein